MDLTLVWAVIIVSGVAVYVILDGFDLGLGILFPFAPSDRDRDIMMRSIAPVWDGNETWLVLGGAGLFAAFPKAYAALLSALYLPLMLMLFALICRGVAFEFRFKAERSRSLWDISFSLGGWLAAFCQGVIVGAIVQGIPLSGGQYAGGPWDRLTPFSLFTGLALVAGYALLGATWLIMKTVGDLQRWSYRVARRMLPLVLLGVAAVSVWTPLAEPAIASRWFSLPNLYYPNFLNPAQESLIF
jgi:cytochrome d ubiquinol oxidase subunit II